MLFSFLYFCDAESFKQNKQKQIMKKVTFAILIAGAAMFASCGGNNAEAEQAKADSLAAAAKADSIAAVEAAAAAEAMAMDTVVVVDTTAAPVMAK